MGVVFGLFAAFYYWLEFFLGMKFSHYLGRLHFWLTFVGVNLTFFPMHFLGLAGMPRRIPDYPDMYWSWNWISSVGSFVTVFGVFVFFFLVWDSYFSNSIFVQVRNNYYVIILNRFFLGKVAKFSFSRIHLYLRNIIFLIMYVFLDLILI